MRSASDIPVIRSMHYALDPVFYNRAHLALLRLACPLELHMERQQVLLQLDHPCWTAFFMQHAGVPLIQWRDFKRARQALDQPVECTLLLYHYHAWLMYPQVLIEMDRQLQRKLEARHVKPLHA